MSSYNIYGGTPKKTLDLMMHFKENSVLYVYHNSSLQFKEVYENTNGKIHEGFYGRNIFKHLKKLLKIIDKEQINIVQTQFTFGEVLGFLIKIFRPNVKLIIAFVSGIKPPLLKSMIVCHFYRFADIFVFISSYTRKEKLRQFPILERKESVVIYNGTEKRIDNQEKIIDMKKFSLLSVASLVKLKNIQIIISALEIIIHKRKYQNVYYYVAGEGNYKNYLQKFVYSKKLNEHVIFLGNQSNIGNLLNHCDIFLHPSYNEGFGIAVAEAMLAQKPTIVANAGALPELIENNKSGLVVDPHDAIQWADAIIKLINNKELADTLAFNAKLKAESDFTARKFSQTYEKLYQTLLSNSK